MKQFIKSTILKLIHLIEKFEYRNLELDENDDSKKIIETIDVSDKNYEVLTDTGYHKITHVHKTQPYKVYTISTEDYTLNCADNHLIYNADGREVYVKDIRIGDIILTEKGPQKITKKSSYGASVSMYDITVDSENHRFYSDGILSHNSVMTAIYVNWYITFNTEKNILIMANKAKTMEEIINKTYLIHKSLPYFLKPGLYKKNQSQLEFDNDCKVFGQATTVSASVGFTVDFLFADEFAKIPDNISTEFWGSIWPTLSSMNNARAVVTSTAYGLNLFYKLYDAASKGLNEFTSLITYWYEVPGRGEEWKKKEIAMLGNDEELFNQEYECQFLTASSLLLDTETLKTIKDKAVEYQHFEIDNFIESEVEYSSLKWDPNKFTDIIENKNEKRFILTIDIAKGIGKDYTVINIFEVQHFKPDEFRTMKCETEKDFIKVVQVGLFRDNSKPINEVAYILMEIINFLGSENVKITIENNLDGDWLYDIMQEKYVDFFDEIFVRTKHTIDAVKRKVGVKITGGANGAGNKTNLCLDLKRLIRSKKVIFNEKDTIEEMLSFGLNSHGSYSSQTGNDDIAMSLVALVPTFNSYEFEAFVEDVIGKMSAEEMNEMYNVIEKNTKESDFAVASGLSQEDVYKKLMDISTED